MENQTKQNTEQPVAGINCIDKFAAEACVSAANTLGLSAYRKGLMVYLTETQVAGAEERDMEKLPRNVKKELTELQNSGLFVPAEALQLTARQEDALYHGYRSQVRGCQTIRWNPLGETRCVKCGKVF
ncbi:MAG: hypothetical protein Q8P44_02105 [Dehalococcoidia bacterium]|nr:hypothetical protein [Dehalococcoidia bacterium]